MKTQTSQTLSLEDLAKSILFGSSLEEKLISAQIEPAKNSSQLPIATPLFPGRPKQLLHIGNSKFPKVNTLNQATTRGHVLHFFANHELLAMELMALVLLKFPEAPLSFRMGIAQTISEEQNHMRLYLSRMQELGVGFGDLPLSDYFWNCLKSMKSPLDFVVQMSLTFEQANLDYSLFYRDEIEKTGDQKTAQILEQVYQEEIGHVKHGLAWFNRWRENPDSENDWDAYKRLLPPPLTPKRAKGIQFNKKVRHEIGFSEKYINELEINSGSKGRPPLVWTYNPHCDAEIVRGSSGFTPSKVSAQISKELEPLLMHLSKNADVVLVKERPRIEWLQKISSDGFQIPEFVTSIKEIKDPKLSGLEPWGWSPEVFEKLKPLREKLLHTAGGRGEWNETLFQKTSFDQTKLGSFFSKSWSTEFLRCWIRKFPETEKYFGSLDALGCSAASKEEVLIKVNDLLSKNHTVLLKACYGTAGNQIKKVQSSQELKAEPLIHWIENIIAQQGALVVEPLLSKLHDLSMQMSLTDGVLLSGPREFFTDDHFSYKGSYLGRSFWNFSSEELKFFNEVLPVWKKLAKDLGHALISGGYQGNAGIDALIWKNASGQLLLKPLVELNPRWTMGRIALELENHIVPGVPAAWLFLKKSSVSLSEIESKFPTKFSLANQHLRLESGVYFTNDVRVAKEVVTALVVGNSALKAFSILK